MNKICVYAITKNESKFVDKWYDSMKEADYIVVLDTGSTDNTVEQLKKYDNIIVESKEINPWRFDTARNEALKLCPSDTNIFISTDLDELLEPGWANILREKWVDGKYERSIYKYSWSHLPNGESGRIFRYDKIHSKNWEWRAPVHELLYNINTNSNLYTYDVTLDLFDDIHLHHYPDRTKSRSSYLPLLELRAEENPEDYYGLIYLSHEYYYRGFYNKSIDLLNRILSEYKDKYNILERASCYLFMGDSYKGLYDEEKDLNIKNNLFYMSEMSYKKAIDLDNTYREPYLALAKLLLSKDKYDEAEIYIKAGIKKSFRHYTWLERDTSWTYEPWDLLCLSTYYNKKYRDSIAYAYKALSYDNNNIRLKRNLEICINSIDDNNLIL